jgi:protein prenyltransferase alpha subunit repeat containing protein 1
MDSQDLIFRLDNIFLEDSQIDEVDFIISGSNEFIHEQHKLGIPYPVATALYAAAHASFLLFHSATSKQTILSISRAMLLVNGACLSAWHWRKRVLAADDVDSELQFVALVLTRHPKSGEAWAHRYLINLSFKF